MLYVNPGYIELMDGSVNGKTVLNGSTLYFYNIYDGYNIKFTDYKELWLKIKVIFDGSIIRFYTKDDSNSIGVRINSNGTYYFWHYTLEYDIIPKNGVFISGKEYELMLHVKSDSSNGLVEFYINGVLDKSYSGSMYGDNFPGITIESDSAGTLFRDVIIADFDITDYHLAPVEIKDYETDFVKQSDGTIKATAMGQYISMHLDTDDLKAKMQKVVENAEIVGVNVGAFNVGYDSSVINALKPSVNGTDAETIKLVNANAAGKILLINPAGAKAWTLSGLKSDTFKLTAEKV